ncbi:hypothetical protein HZA55_02710 [Candidatus Poribacteria bacterium]|nr:hypothetical protein [Candidatus Poribacteria bacterium]
MIDYIPILLLILPLLSALLIWCNKEEKNAGLISIICAFLIFIFTIFAYSKIMIEKNIIIFNLPVFVYGLELAIDGLSFLFLLITTLIWFLSMIFAKAYMEHEHNKKRYYFFSLLTLACNLGVLMGRDLFTIFIFFELMGMLSYILIVHTEKEEAFQAGKKYISMTILGGLCLLMGIFLYFQISGTLDIYSFSDSSSTPFLKSITLITLLIGFGVKAGMLPLHVWLPDAHPAAPTPASAVLSGVMIKVGAYGIIRVTQLPLFTSTRDLFQSQMGYFIIWIGIATMFVGVVLALLQSNAKRLLAYHSVSQMGYILMGIGCASYLGSKGAIGIAGSVFHILNHALFKSALFFAAGAVYLQTHEYNLYNLGGLSRKMPYLALFTVIAACGIGGIPVFNGYISKTLLHHAIVESYEVRHDQYLKIAEIIFMITSMGTLCSFIKFAGLTFFGKPHRDINDLKEPSFLLNLSPAILSACIIFIGICNQFFIKNFIIPSIERFYKPEMLEVFKHVNFCNTHSLSGVLPAIIGGPLLFIIGMKSGLFHLHIPAPIGFDFWYKKLADAGECIVYSGYNTYKKCENYIKSNLRNDLHSTFETYNNIFGQHQYVTPEGTYISNSINNSIETLYVKLSAIYHDEIYDCISYDFKNMYIKLSAIYHDEIYNYISYDIKNIFKTYYMKLRTIYHDEINKIEQILYNAFKKIEANIIELDIKRIEWYEYTKLRLACFILKKWLIPLVDTYHPDVNIEDLKSTGKNIESLFNLKEKIDNMRSLHHYKDSMSFLEIESMLEEKSKILSAQKDIYTTAAQNMLQYYTSDISIGIFVIIIIIAIYFVLVLLKI